MIRHGKLGIAALVLTFMAALATAAEPDEPATAGDSEQVRLLVATPSLSDSTFSRSVILILKQDDDGALGIMVNRPTPATIALVFPHMDKALTRTDTLYLGGPVQPTTIFVLLRAKQAPPGAERVLPGVFVSTRQPSFDHALDENWPPERMRVIAGYSGWGAGQLEHEIARGDWRYHPATAPALFDVPAEHLWDALTAQSRGQWASRVNDHPDPHADTMAHAIN